MTPVLLLKVVPFIRKVDLGNLWTVFLGSVIYSLILCVSYCCGQVNQVKCSMFVEENPPEPWSGGRMSTASSEADVQAKWS